MSVLYISYDGMMEPLGKSQVISYLKQLVSDRVIVLISFEKPHDVENFSAYNNLKLELSDSGIIWYPLVYHKWPSILSTLWDIICGTFISLILINKYKLKIIHARSYVPSVIVLIIKKIINVQFLFDMRGFWADERVEGNIWKKYGFIYYLTKWFERKFILSADHIVSLTHSAVKEIKKIGYNLKYESISVIPTCADLSKFKPLHYKNKNQSVVIGYVGSVGTWYMFEEMAECFLILLSKRPDSKFLIINKGENAFIKNILSIKNIPSESVEIISVSHEDVPKHIARMDAGIFFIRPVYSKIASAPTKLAEFLGCGKPCLSNTGVGDMTEILESQNVGVTINEFNVSSMTEGLENLLILIKDKSTLFRCVETAEKFYSLEEGVNKYKSIYDKLDNFE